MKIGIIGMGKVGKTVYDVLMKHHSVRGYDKFKPSDRFGDALDSEVVFVAVPTPMGKDDRLDCSIMYDVIQLIESSGYKGVVVLKSTLKVGFFKNLKTDLRVVYNPEFLHEKNRWNEFEDPYFVVLAGKSGDIETVKKVYCWLPPCKFEIVSLEEAEMIKLIMNAFATTKISFWNQMKMICDKRNVDVCRIRNILRKDISRWSDEYTDPLKGPYGGACLPKDTQELINAFENTPLLEAVEQVNDIMKNIKE